MAETTQEHRIVFEVPEQEPDVYPIYAVQRGPEVFITVCAKTAELGNSHAAKKAAYEARRHEKVAMTEAGIEPQGAAYPVFAGGGDQPIRVGSVQDASGKEIRYHRVFRLKPAM